MSITLTGFGNRVSGSAATAIPINPVVRMLAAVAVPETLPLLFKIAPPIKGALKLPFVQAFLSGQIEAVERHHLGPGGDEVIYKLFLAID